MHREIQYKVISVLLLLLACNNGLHAAAPGSYEAFIDSAENYVEKGKFELAAESYRNALRKSPGSPLNSMIFANLGMCLTETGDTQGAIQAYGVALIRDPESINILKARAKTYLKAEMVAEALADLNTILKIDSLSEDALCLRGRLYLVEMELTFAQRDLEQLYHHYPNNPYASISLAQCLSLMNKEEAAVPLYREALKTERTALCYQGLASALINTGKEEEAFEVIREGIELFPREGNLYLMRGIINKIMYRTQESASDKRIAINLGVDKDIADRLLPLNLKNGK